MGCRINSLRQSTDHWPAHRSQRASQILRLLRHGLKRPEYQRLQQHAVTAVRRAATNHHCDATEQVDDRGDLSPAAIAAFLGEAHFQEH